MKVKISYSQNQLDAAVKFISENNISFRGKDSEIRGCILQIIDRLSTDSNNLYVGTMGFYILAARDFEDMDNDDNTIHFEILVDPSVGQKYIHHEHTIGED